jgi:SHS2 domain-containing protein
MITSDKARGFIEIPHTADWAVRIWAPNFWDLLIQAGEAMYALQMVKLDPTNPASTVKFSIQGDDQETSLVGFLSELLFQMDTNRLVLTNFTFHGGKSGLNVSSQAIRLLSQSKEIKAVTYSGLKVELTPRGLEATLVFDV